MIIRSSIIGVIQPDEPLLCFIECLGSMCVLYEYALKKVNNNTRENTIEEHQLNFLPACFLWIQPVPYETSLERAWKEWVPVLVLRFTHEGIDSRMISKQGMDLYGMPQQ